eukprot:403330850
MKFSPDKHGTKGGVSTKRLLDDHNQARNNPAMNVTQMRDSVNSTASFADNQIPLNDQIRMGALQKYKKYNLFPWKMIVHLIIVFLTTLQILAVVETTGGYSLTQSNLFYYSFLNSEGDDAQYNKQDIVYQKYIYSRTQLKAIVLQSVQNYYNLESYETIEEYHLDDEDNGGKPYDIQARYYYLSSEYDPIEDVAFEIYNRDYHGPFDDDVKLGKMLNEISQFSINYKVKNLIPEEAPATANCYLWDLIQNYDFKDRGYVKLTLSMERKICTTPYDNAWTNMIWIPILNLLFSLISFILIIKYFMHVVQIYRRMRRKYQAQKYTDEMMMGGIGRFLSDYDKSQNASFLPPYVNNSNQPSFIGGDENNKSQGGTFIGGGNPNNNTIAGGMPRHESNYKRANSVSLNNSYKNLQRMNSQYLGSIKGGAGFLSNNLNSNNLYGPAGGEPSSLKFHQSPTMKASPLMGRNPSGAYNNINLQRNDSRTVFPQVPQQNSTTNLNFSNAVQQQQPPQSQQSLVQMYKQNQLSKQDLDKKVDEQLAKEREQLKLNENEKNKLGGNQGIEEMLEQMDEDIDYQINWDDMTFADKAKLFKYWSIVQFVANIIQIFAALFFILKSYFGLHISEYLCGFGCVLPLYIGAVLLFTALFQNSNRFQSFSQSAMHLYSMINGDELQDSFRDLAAVDLLLGLFFAYTYVFVGYAVIVNMFIAIIEDGFLSTKYKSRFAWLKNKQSNNKEGVKEEEKLKNNGEEPDKSPINGQQQHNNSISMFSNGRQQSMDGNNLSMATFDRKLSVSSKQMEQQLRQDRSMRTLKSIIDTEANKWKQRKSTINQKYAAINTDSSIDNKNSLFFNKKKIEEEENKKKLQEEQLHQQKLKLNEKQQILKERAHGMTLYHCQKIKQQLALLDAEFVKLQKLGDAEKDYDVAVMIENEKQSVVDTVQGLIVLFDQLIEDVNQS